MHVLEAVPGIYVGVTNPILGLAVDLKLIGIPPAFISGWFSAEPTLNPAFRCVVHQPNDRVESLLRRGLQEPQKRSFPIGCRIQHQPISEPETIERQSIVAVWVRGLRFVYADREQNLAR